VAIVIHGTVLTGRFVVISGAILGVLIIPIIFLRVLRAIPRAVTPGGAAARRRAEQGHHCQPDYDQLEEPPAVHEDVAGVGSWHSLITVVQLSTFRNGLVHRVLLFYLISPQEAK
jgi:hypothetical protein